MLPSLIARRWIGRQTLKAIHFSWLEPELLVIIIIISIFIEDNVFSTTASLPYGPLVNTDIDYFWTFFVIMRC